MAITHIVLMENKLHCAIAVTRDVHSALVAWIQIDGFHARTKRCIKPPLPSSSQVRIKCARGFTILDKKNIGITHIEQS